MSEALLKTDVFTLSRRNMLAASVVLAGGLLLPATSIAGNVQAFGASQGTVVSQNSNPSVATIHQNNADFWAAPRVLHLRRRQTGEVFHGVYFRDGQLDPEAYRRINWLMRDVKKNKAVNMDPRLLDLLCAMQAWVGYYGYKKPIVINSGYRTPEYNSTLEGAARNSMHLYGRAADVVFPDLPVSYLGRLAQNYTAGGVGFYISSGFVHVDTGNIRSWGRRQ